MVYSSDPWHHPLGFWKEVSLHKPHGGSLSGSGRHSSPCSSTHTYGMCRTSWQESVLLREWQPYGSDTPTHGRTNSGNVCLFCSIQNLFILIFYFTSANWNIQTIWDLSFPQWWLCTVRSSGLLPLVVLFLISSFSKPFLNILPGSVMSIRACPASILLSFIFHVQNKHGLCSLSKISLISVLNCILIAPLAQWYTVFRDLMIKTLLSFKYTSYPMTPTTNVEIKPNEVYNS